MGQIWPTPGVTDEYIVVNAQQHLLLAKKFYLVVLEFEKV